MRYLELVSKVSSASVDDMRAATSSNFAKKSSVYLSGYTSGCFARFPRLASHLANLATKLLLRPVLTNSLQTSLSRWTLITTSLFFISSGDTVAQPTGTSYPTAPTISSAPLAPEKRELLNKLFRFDLTYDERVDISEKLCPQALTTSSPDPDLAKSAVLVTEASLATELLFERSTESGINEVSSISFVLAMHANRALLQHRQPRFPSATAGFLAPMPNDRPRAVRVEGKLGSDILALVPATRECGVQAVALCPSTFKPPNTLLRAPYKLKGARAIINLKADGLYSPPKDAIGVITASLMASPPLRLPEKWRSSSKGSTTLSAEVKHSDNAALPANLPQFITIDSLPFYASIEARVDVGSEQSALRTARKRINLDISPIIIKAQEHLFIEKTEFSVEGGECYLISSWVEGTV
jgi:hypothetical protein